ncbi:MAG: FliI/YscN family ATPase [Spirochaetaceae bacterium]|jgi:flagellum-specific ATP synthase|nr:FliI/YscN family ATPase [Spirochaetaceae bacterium]
MQLFEKYLNAIENLDSIKCTGTVSKVQGVIIESIGPVAAVGEVCKILINRGNREIAAEVVALKEDKVQLMPYDEMHGIELGCKVIATGSMLSVSVSDDMLGRVLNGMGKPMDDKGPIGCCKEYPAMNIPPDSMKRKMIKERLITGVRAIDGLTPVGRGQRLGIFSGSGVGKSTLLSMIARNTNADINVIALIGERGREVREFIENDLGEEGLKRSVVIVSTSDTPALSRVRGAFVATAVAEYFRDQGKDVMLLFDSVTRFAMSQREIGLAIGEPPATKGYTPSVFTLLPKLLERSGTSEVGSITGIYTVLVEGGDMDDPIADAVRGILDGHIVLSRKIAEKYHYPAIDVLSSISRLEPSITEPATRKGFGNIRRMLALYTEKEDLINIGAYVKGSNAAIDEAIDKIGEINSFLQQGIHEKAELERTLEKAGNISGIDLMSGGLVDEKV